MSQSSQLFIRTGGFLYDRLSLAELAEWVQDREEYWAALPAGEEANHLAGTIMLAVYEVQDGSHDEASAKELIRRATMEPASPGT
jgi:hypothetical protein